MYSSLKKTFNIKHFYLEMEERSVDRPDSFGDEQFLYDENTIKRSSWKFCNSAKLPRSDVVFFLKL